MTQPVAADFQPKTITDVLGKAETLKRVRAALEQLG